MKIVNLSKSYGQKTALDQISFEIKENEIYGLLGRNGAGKSSLLQAISNQITYTGDIYWKGERVDSSTDLRGKVILVSDGISSENKVLSQRLSRTLEIYDSFIDSFDLPYAQKLCRDFDLDLTERYVDLSRGKKALFEMLLGLASRAEITLLDEPVSGIDTVNRYHFYDELMSDWQDYPRTIVLSTHIISEIEDYLTRLICLDQGQLILDDDLESVQARSQIVEGVQPRAKILDQKELAGRHYYYIFEELPEEEEERILSSGGQLSPLPLDRLFVSLLGGETKDEDV